MVLTTTRVGRGIVGPDQQAEVYRFASGQFVIALSLGGVDYKLFQVVLSASDGSVYVTFPYFRHRHGYVAEVALPQPGDSMNVSLPDEGWRTSYRVKFTHHASGIAHFSENDERVEKVVRKRAKPLREVNGHLFTVYVRGLDDFERVRPKDLKYDPARRATLTLNFPNAQRDWEFRIVGGWYTLSQYVALRRRILNTPTGAIRIGPQEPYQDDSGRLADQILLSPPAASAAHHCVLELRAEGGDFLQTDEASHLISIGGFDQLVDADDGSVSTYLMLSFSANVADDRYQSMRTIDRK